MNREDIKDYEFDWFATDYEGNMGHFSTAGYGPVPKTVDIDAHNMLSEFLGTSVSYHLLTTRKGKNEDWIHMAQCGIFSYDWQHWKGPYLAIAHPKVSIKVSNFPSWIQEICRQVHFSTLSFSNNISIPVENYFDCE